MSAADRHAPTSEQPTLERTALRRRATAYLPSTLLAAVEHHGVEHPTFIEPTEGTLVFADVSGFTPLSEGLAATGREGSERLTAILNDFFGRMLTIASKWGGSNQKFGGDAMLLLFTGPEHARRAVESALEMQAETKRFPAVKVGPRRHKLAMSLGVHSGRFWAAGVGLPDVRMQHLLLGRDCARVADAETAASAGQVVVTAATERLVNAGLVTTELDESPGMYLVGRRRNRAEPSPRSGQRPAPDDQTVLAYLPPPLALALGNADDVGELEDEHRRVVVLFISVVGLNELLDAEGAPEALRQAQAYVETLARLTEKHGGFISGNDIDNKGIKLIVLFGAPIAKEDDAASALRLAVELMAEIEKLGLDVRHRIGINAGYVFAGDVGSDLRRDYTVIGDAVNLAARLMGAADAGGVVVADWVASEAGDGFDLRDSRAIRVKGKSMPIPVHTLGGQTTEAGHFLVEAKRPKVIGRERERRSARRASARAEAGSPRTLVVHGEAGVGGSALVNEISHELAERGWTVFRGRCQQYLSETPFAPLIALFERLLGVADAIDEQQDERSSRVVRTLEDLAPHLVPFASLLNGLISVRIEETDVVRALGATERSERLTWLLVEVVAAAAEVAPLIVMVEGLHFADRSTIRFVEQGSRDWKRGRLLVAVTYRDDLAPDFEPFRSRTVDISLGPLDRAGSDSVVRDLLGSDDVPEVLLSEIYRRGRGNVLVTAELVRAVGASPLLDGDTELGTRQIQDLLGELDVTDRLQQLMMARIDRLATGPRWALTRAAVLGSRFDVATLETLLRADGKELAVATALQQLVEAGLLEPEADTANTSYTFRHEAVRDVAYDSILFRTRRDLHRDLAHHLVDAHAGEVDRESATIAGHFRIAGDHERAALFGVRAGDWALSSYAIGEAETLYAVAADQYRAAGRSFAAYRSFVIERLGDCVSLGGRPSEAAQHHIQALRSWNRLQDGEGTRLPRNLTHGAPRAMRHAELCRKIAHAHQRADHYERALEWLDRAERAASPRAPRLFRARLAALRGTTLFRLGRYEAAAEEGSRAVALAERTGDQATIAYARDMLAMTYLEQGRLRDAIEQRVEAVRLFEAEGDLRGSMGCHNNLGAAYQLVGSLEEALEHYEQAAAAAVRLGNMQGRAVIENNIGEVLLAQGRLDDASARFAIAVSVHEQTGQAPAWAGLALVNQSRVDVQQGQLVRAAESLEAGTRLLRRARARGLLLEAAQQRVELLVAGGQFDDAARANQRFVREARRLGLQLFEARGAIFAGRLALREGDDAGAVDQLRSAIRLAEEVGALREQADAWEELVVTGLDPDAPERLAGVRRQLGV